MAGYWPSSFFCGFMDRDKVEVHKLAKKERGPYPAILTEQTWSIKDLLCGFQGNFLRDTAGSPEQARWLHLARSGSHSQGAIWVILPARGASQIIIVYTKTVGHLGLVFSWSLEFIWRSLRNLCSGTCRKIQNFAGFNWS